MLAAAGASLPAAASPPRLSTKKESVAKARLLGMDVEDREGDGPSAARAAGSEPSSLSTVADGAAVRRSRDPLLAQGLPRKFMALEDMFGGCGKKRHLSTCLSSIVLMLCIAHLPALPCPAATRLLRRCSGPALPLRPPAAALQTVHEMMRRRGGRTSYQALRGGVEEACGRRFLLTHLAQLHHLLPEAIGLEWVRLPVDRHSSRTEPHLMITLAAGAAGGVAGGGAAGRGTASPSPAAQRESQLTLLRQRLHRRLAGHLLGSYRSFLEAGVAEARARGDAAAAAELEAAPTEPPLQRFVPPYPEDAADVPEQPLPARPDPAPARASPSALSSALLPPPSTPRTSAAGAAGPTPRTALGRPPVHPRTVERARLQQRRLSFSGAAPPPAGAAAPAPPPGRVTKPGAGVAPLPGDKQQQQQQAQGQGQGQQPPAKKGLGSAAWQQPAAIAEEAESGLGEEQWGGCILSQAEADAALLASMPEELRRRSTDGIISMEALRVRRARAHTAAARPGRPATASAASCTSLSRRLRPCPHPPRCWMRTTRPIARSAAPRRAPHARRGWQWANCRARLHG